MGAVFQDRRDLYKKLCFFYGKIFSYFDDARLIIIFCYNFYYVEKMLILYFLFDCKIDQT